MNNQIAAVLSVLMLAVPVQAEENPTRDDFSDVLKQPMPDYLTDVIDKPDYRMKWNGLFEGEVGVDQWLAEYPDNGAVEHPVEYVEEGGFVFEIYSLCEPHNCWGSKFTFVVSKTCPLVHGVMTSFDEVTRQFGVKLKFYDGDKPIYVLPQFADLCRAELK
ncbi:Inhibitor of vertebrate lysozyme (Ivy) [Marinobacterium sp. xm-g-59]|uniref:Ivy family c-type lysozyme inhibitor n=1 Tax=Marinobacterium sp. xm-g-59 TaxID=2497748 RepID=UPI00156A7323|nr:Ivy family c-type lysozyme inhibitor [Marinobacterium sp. xm-g-59]NRP94849.1 Inhibitor of vertebrate lysozyme (Ivy) [Marinobacterium sp. xm-g-59]